MDLDNVLKPKQKRQIWLGSVILTGAAVLPWTADYVGKYLGRELIGGITVGTIVAGLAIYLSVQKYRELYP